MDKADRWHTGNSKKSHFEDVRLPFCQEDSKFCRKLKEVAWESEHFCHVFGFRLSPFKHHCLRTDIEIPDNTTREDFEWGIDDTKVDLATVRLTGIIGRPLSYAVRQVVKATRSVKKIRKRFSKKLRRVFRRGKKEEKVVVVTPK